MGLAQLLFQFRQRHIRLSGHAARRYCLTSASSPLAVLAQLARPLLPPALQLLAADLLAVSITDAKLPRQFLQAPSPRCIGLNSFERRSSE